MSDFHKKRFEFMSDCDETRYNKEMIKYNDEKKILNLCQIVMKQDITKK